MRQRLTKSELAEAELKKIWEAQAAHEKSQKLKPLSDKEAVKLAAEVRSEVRIKARANKSSST